MPVNFSPAAASMALRDLDHGFGGGHTATPRAAIDLDKAFDLGAVLLRARRQIRHIGQIIDADNRACAKLWQPGQTVDLGRIAHLVGDQYVLYATTGEDFGLRHFLAADTHRAAQGFLQLGHIHRFVHLAVHPVAHAMRLGIVAHLLDVALQRIQIQHRQGV